VADAAASDALHGSCLHAAIEVAQGGGGGGTHGHPRHGTRLTGGGTWCGVERWNRR
jgi:hypothetical protein